MKIFYDENMPFAQEFFGDVYGETTELVSFVGRELNAKQVADADVLLVRSITKVNEALLYLNTKLKFVGTATIGVDHIDQAYLNKRGVTFTASPGCNAVSVADYVLSALVILSEKYNASFLNKTVGIVGGGNTGTQVSKKLQALGIKYKMCDPILQQQGDKREFSTLDDVLACDVISLHVPKTLVGEHATYHLLNEERLNKLSEQQILINACRGEIIDNQALFKLKQSGHSLKLVLDVWENEPDILIPLIEYTDIATSHIAGYSLEGKSRGTEMLYQALCQLEGKLPTKQLSDFLPEPEINETKIKDRFSETLLNQTVKIVYDVRRDDEIFRQQILTFGFDHIRKTYPIRREFSSLSIIEESIYTDKNELQPLYGLGFKQVS